MIINAPEVVIEVALAIAIGGLIGLEREHTDKKKYAGIRTLALLAGVAPGMVLISEKTGTSIFTGLYMLLAATFSVGVVYVRMKLDGENIGFTTSVAVFATAVIGLLIGYNLYQEAAMLGLLTAVILAEKNTLHSYIDKLEDQEVSKAFQLGAISFILLPILPAAAIDPLGAIVPREIVLLAVFVMTIEFISYITLRQLSGSSGIYLTGLIGGGASSFATTGVLAKIGQNEKFEHPAASGILLCTVTMMFRNLGIAAVLLFSQGSANPLNFIWLFAPVLAMTVPLLGFALWLKQGDVEVAEMPMDSPFSLKSGAKFATIFILVSASSALGNEFIGSTATYLTAFGGGLVSSSAVATSAATSFLADSVTGYTAALMIILSILGSMLSKILLVEIENEKMRLLIAGPMVLSAMFGGLVALLI
jgi:uncharacterized membrane protein (DUF4010 family)